MSGDKNGMFGRDHTDESKQIMSENRIGKNVGPDNHNYGWDVAGSNNPNWRGGKSTKRNLFGSSQEYRTWRNSIYERDDYTCQQCNKRGGDLNVHHIYPYADYPDPQFSLNMLNGITLCVDCHRETFGKEYDFISEFLDITMNVNTQHEILISGT